MKFTGSKAVFIAIPIFFCFVSVLTISGCIKSDKESVSDLVDSTLSIANMKESEFLSESTEALADYGLTTNDVLDAYFHDYEFKIREVSIKGTSATVNCDISIIRQDEFLDVFTEKAIEYASSDDVKGLTEKEINLRLGQILLESMKETDTRTTNLDILLEKADGTWAITNLNDIERVIVGQAVR